MITICPQRDKSKTISALEKIRNIFVITEIIGPFDILAIAPVTDLNSIRAIVNEINKLPDVQKVEITCINNTDFPFNAKLEQIIKPEKLRVGNCLNWSSSLNKTAFSNLHV